MYKHAGRESNVACPTALMHLTPVHLTFYVQATQLIAKMKNPDCICNVLDESQLLSE